MAGELCPVPAKGQAIHDLLVFRVFLHNVRHNHKNSPMTAKMNAIQS